MSAKAYEGYVIGPHIRQMRKDRKWSVNEMAERTGLSNSSVEQIEQGGRNLSIRSLYLYMNAYGCDANTVLGIEEQREEGVSIDEKIKEFPKEKQELLVSSFMMILEQVKKFV